jgi:hypothetical protein
MEPIQDRTLLVRGLPKARFNIADIRSAQEHADADLYCFLMGNLLQHCPVSLDLSEAVQYVALEEMAEQDTSAQALVCVASRAKAIQVKGIIHGQWVECVECDEGGFLLWAEFEWAQRTPTRGSAIFGARMMGLRVGQGAMPPNVLDSTAAANINIADSSRRVRVHQRFVDIRLPRLLETDSSDEETPPLPRMCPSRPQRASSRSLRERSRSRDGPPDARFGAVFAEAGSDPGDSSEPGRPRTRDHLHRKHYRAWLAHLQGIVGTQAAPNASTDDERERRDVRRLLTDFGAFVLENDEWWWTSPMARLLRRHNELQQRKASRRRAATRRRGGVRLARGVAGSQQRTAMMRRWLRRSRLGVGKESPRAWLRRSRLGAAARGSSDPILALARNRPEHVRTMQEAQAPHTASGHPLAVTETDPYMDEEDPTIGNNDSDDVDGQRNPYIASAPPPAIEPLPAFQITDPSLAMAIGHPSRAVTLWR